MGKHKSLCLNDWTDLFCSVGWKIQQHVLSLAKYRTFSELNMDLFSLLCSPQGNELRKILLTRYFGNQKIVSKSETGSGNSSSGGFVKPTSGGQLCTNACYT